MKNIVTKAVIFLVLACQIGMVVSAQKSFGEGLNSETTFNIRITREKFAEFHNTLIIPEEDIRINLEEIHFDNFDLLTGDLVYDEMFSMRSHKFEPDIFKKQEEKVYTSNKSMQGNINTINLSGTKISSNMKKTAVSGEFQRKIKKAASMVKSGASVLQVEPILAELEKMSVNDSVKLSNVAKLYMKAGNPEKACEVLQHAEILDPNNYKILYTHAICLYKMNKLDVAEHKLKKVAALQPDFMYAYYNLGNIYYKGKKYHKALDAFKQAMSLSPGIPDIYYNIGLTLEQLNHREFARKFYQKCLQINPKDSGALRAIERLK